MSVLNRKFTFIDLSTWLLYKLIKFKSQPITAAGFSDVGINFYAILNLKRKKNKWFSLDLIKKNDFLQIIWSIIWSILKKHLKSECKWKCIHPIRMFK